MGQNPHKNTPKFCGKPSQNSGGCYSSKEGTNSILVPLLWNGFPESSYWYGSQESTNVLLCSTSCIQQMTNKSKSFLNNLKKTFPSSPLKEIMQTLHVIIFRMPISNQVFSSNISNWLHRCSFG